MIIPKSFEDLKTTHGETVQGFLDQALAKNEKARPYVKTAVGFLEVLQQCKTIDDILNLQEYKDCLIAAAGFSDKSKSKITADELNKSLKKVLKTILIDSNTHFREEIVFRYLLTKGDSLGGSMRNLTGSLASKKFIKMIKAELSRLKMKAVIEKGKNGKVQTIKWRDRILFFDVTPKFLGKNIDILLLKSNTIAEQDKDLLKDPQNYLACGELKGGIDPAGADEHWKTANSALERIRYAFSKLNKPALFFIGAAIESWMSQEILDQLKTGKLDFAANLTKDDQVENLAKWLVNL